MKTIVSLMLVFCFAVTPGLADSGEKATVQEVYDTVLKSAQVLENLGEEGLAAFNDPNGEFVWKDTYAFVMNCEEGKIVAHPVSKFIGLTTDKVKCFKTGKPIMREACGVVNPSGFWKEYWWPKLGSKEIGRKVVFLIPVPETSYQVGAGIYDDNMTIEELNEDA